MNRRILILAPRDRDAGAIEQVLDGDDRPCVRCRDADHLRAEMDRGAAVAVVTEEGLGPDRVPGLQAWLARQPAWSDFPFVLLTSRGAQQRSRLRAVMDALGNVVVLERPINVESLSSTVSSALRGRDRQFEVQRLWAARDHDEQRLRMALAAGNLGSWSLDLPDRALSCSDRFKGHFGREPGNPLSFADLVAAVLPEDLDRHRATVEAAFSRPVAYKVELRVTWPDATVHWIQISGRTVLGHDGAPATMSGVTLDVTERRRSEDVLQSRVTEAVADSQRAQAALVQSQKMEAVGQLTGGIAHDFNNLLTAIVGNIDMIVRRTEDERVRTLANRAHGACDRATKLTGQLLAFSRSQRLDLKPVRIDALIGGMRDLLARSIGPTVAVDTDLGVPDRSVTADANQLELALLNLAINARDAMPGGGRLTIRTRHEPGSGRDGDFVVVSVADTGTGIPADLMSKVFDPFFTTKPVGKGTGLGLSQVHGIAHQSGGSVRIESEVGRGTLVEVRLLETEDAARDAGSVASAADAPGPGTGRVLVVDDDPDVRRFVVDCLETLGFSVTEADHGRAGLERLDLDRPDLMIVDFAMPGMNGAQVAVAARARRADLPIILATGYADTGAVEGTFAKEAILRKPFQIGDLSRAVNRMMTSSAPHLSGADSAGPPVLNAHASQDQPASRNAVL